MGAHTKEELKQLQALPLNEKVNLTKKGICADYKNVLRVENELLELADKYFNMRFKKK